MCAAKTLKWRAFHPCTGANVNALLLIRKIADCVSRMKLIQDEYQVVHCSAVLVTSAVTANDGCTKLSLSVVAFCSAASPTLWLYYHTFRAHALVPD